jgi:hypothetical protein
MSKRSRRIALGPLAVGLALLLPVSVALADHAFWGEGRSDTLDNVRFSGSNYIPVTLRSTGPQVDMGSLLRVMDEAGATKLLAGAGIVVRANFAEDEAQGFLWVCTDLSGCAGTWELLDTDHLHHYQVNQGLSQGQFGAAVQLSGTGCNSTFGPCSVDIDHIVQDRGSVATAHARVSGTLGNIDGTVDGQAAFYARNQENDSSGAFTVQYPLWTNAVETVSGLSQDNFYSFSSVKHPNSNQVKMFSISSTKKGICAVVVDNNCPDP